MVFVDLEISVTTTEHLRMKSINTSRRRIKHLLYPSSEAHSVHLNAQYMVGFYILMMNMWFFCLPFCLESDLDFMILGQSCHIQVQSNCPKVWLLSFSREEIRKYGVFQSCGKRNTRIPSGLRLKRVLRRWSSLSLSKMEFTEGMVLR